MHCAGTLVLFLIPKNMFWAERESAESIRAIPLGKDAKRQLVRTWTQLPGPTRWEKAARGRVNR